MRELEGALRLSQLSALSLLEMSSSESLGVEHGEPLSTSSNLRFRPRDDTVSMETLLLGQKYTAFKPPNLSLVPVLPLFGWFSVLWGFSEPIFQL